jgi:hypothetical protein
MHSSATRIALSRRRVANSPWRCFIWTYGSAGNGLAVFFQKDVAGMWRVVGWQGF